VFLAFVILSISNAHSGPSQGANTTAEPQYLMVQIFTAGPGFTADAGKHAKSKLPEPAFLDVEPKKIHTSRVRVATASTGSGLWRGRSRWTTPTRSCARSSIDTNRHVVGIAARK
jgi:hypothetical protein